MIYLQEIFDDLAYGEFTNMAISKTSVGTINPTQFPKLVSLINSGLLSLYTKFPIKKKEFDLYQRAGYTQYYLRPNNVGNVNAGDPNIYIDGTGSDPINGDIIKLIEAYDSLGNEIRINNNNYPDDIFLPEPDIIKIKERDPLEVISIVYHASYPRIIVDATFNPATYALYIPSWLKEPLVAFVASKLFTGKTSNAAEGQGNLSNTFMYKYERLCNEIENKNLIPVEINKDERFDNNGWA